MPFEYAQLDTYIKEITFSYDTKIDVLSTADDYFTIGAQHQRPHNNTES